MGRTDDWTNRSWISGAIQVDHLHQVQSNGGDQSRWDRAVHVRWLQRITPEAMAEGWRELIPNLGIMQIMNIPQMGDAVRSNNCYKNRYP